ncbi:antitoxin HicB [Gammaproteobacteria bacterium]
MEVASKMRYAIVIERATSKYSAYVSDLPGCIATGKTIEETKQQIKETIKFHLEGMREDHLPIPTPKRSDRTCGYCHLAQFQQNILALQTRTTK